jgi:hypothetical protein
MDSRCRRLLLLAAAALAASPGGAADIAPGWVLPPLDGEVAGELTPLYFPGAPALQYRASIRAVTPRERTVAVALAGPGLSLRGSAVLDSQGEGTWAVEELTLDLGEWFGWVGPRLLPALAKATLQGQLTAKGAGTWRGGVLGGRATIEVRDGRYEDPALGLTLEGIKVRLDVVDVGERRTAPGQVLEWSAGKADLVPLGPGRVEFALEGDTLKIGLIRVAVFGGELEVGPTEFSARRPAVDFSARMRGVELRQVLFLLPPVLVAAQGRLDGQIALRRDSAGLQIGIGRLTLRQGEKADLQFAPSPGLLTAQLPAQVKQYYPGLEKLETGGIPLRAERMEIELTPAGDEQGRTATVHIEGGPVDPALKSPVVLQINVRGPLESVVKFGTHSKLRFGGGGK